jgi:hypothetical protein
MPSFKTYRDDKYIYSVDMMMAYVNTNKHPIEKVPVLKHLQQLQQPVWGDYSPSDVLQHPERKKYADNIKRIKEADLSYPIFMTSKYQIIDGYHRFLKAVQENQMHIKAYIFDPPLLRKFILNKELDFVAVHQKMAIHELLELYVRRFCKDK